MESAIIESLLRSLINYTVQIMIAIVGILIGGILGSFYRGKAKNAIIAALSVLVGGDVLIILLSSHNFYIQLNAGIFLISLLISFIIFYLIFGRFKMGIALGTLRPRRF